jgi:hypothetical protein
MLGQDPQQALFKSAAPDGKTVMLSVGQDGCWTLTCDGKPVTDGSGEGLTIALAVRRFRELVHPRGQKRAD